MGENILLMFLSDIKFRNGEVQETLYTNLDGEKTHATNESAVRYLLQNDSAGAGLAKIFIVASKAVRENIRDYPEKITHLEYFKNRMKKFLPNAEDCVTVHEYDEENSGAENLKSVAEVAQKIQNFAAKSQSEVILHTDLTGGMRHINMMMLDIIRLLEYSGVKIGKIIYSNYNPQKKVGTVEEVKNIYDLFQLISGVEEFINFGSVKVLKDYYKNRAEKISVALKNLLDAMENFAEAIKLCRYGQFKFAIEKLHDAINDFSADENNLNDVLMLRLIERIKQEYSMLISTRGQDDLKIINWCVRKGYLQQALTLYTERVPEYIGEKFITQTEKNSADLEKRVAEDNLHRNKFFYLFSAVEGSPSQDQKNFNKAMKTFIGEIKDNALLKIRKNKFVFDDWFKNVNEKIQSLNMIFLEAERLRGQFEVFGELFKNPDALANLDSEKLAPIREIIDAADVREISEISLRRKKILEFVQGKITVDSMKNYFPVPQKNNTFEKKYPKAFRLHYLIAEKYFSLKNISEDEFLNVMDRYFRFKDERNHSNHARNDIGEFGTAKILERCILDGLEQIENFAKR